MDGLTPTPTNTPTPTTIPTNTHTPTLIPNQPPIANAGLNQSGNEGDTFVIDGSTSTDPDGNQDIVSYGWDLGDNTNDSGQTITHDYQDNGDFNVSLTIADTLGLMDMAMITITVNNVAPTATFINASGDINLWETATFTFSNQNDPSSVDTAAGFTYAYDCNDDGSFEVSGTSSDTHNCSYAESGLHSQG